MRVTAEKRRRGTRREHVIDAALESFIEVGYTGTTVTEIERRAGLKPGSGSFYRHFASKAEVLDVAVQREVDRAHAAIDEGMASLAPIDGTEPSMYERLLATADWLEKYDRLIRLALHEGDRTPEVRRAISNALSVLAPKVKWEEVPELVMAIAALSGYRLLSELEGYPFQHAPRDEFVRLLAAMVTAVSKVESS